MDGQITLTHAIEINGQPKTVLRIRHRLSMGDLAAVQRYARRNDLPGGVDDLLEAGDIGAILALVESLCQLPAGTLDQLHPDDFPAVVEAATPFLGGTESPATGKPPSES
jgi:hypothetical protein